MIAGLPAARRRVSGAGGLWSEAIDVYLQLESFEKVGDLFRRIGQEERADDAFRRTMSMRLAAGDYLEAARLAEQKLGAPQEALRYLAAAWPNSDQAITCLNQMFTLLAAQGQHEDAQKLIEQTDPCLLVADGPKKTGDVLADVAVALSRSASPCRGG